MKLLMYSVFLFLLAPCNGTKKTASTDTASSDDLKTVSFVFERTPCFGSCPYFEMTITGATKTAVYKGKRNVSKMGEFHKSISEKEIKALMDAFDKAKFFDFKDQYTAKVTDLPTTYVTYAVNGKSKKVEDYYNAPAELKSLEKLLDDIANSEGWEQSDSSDH